MRVPDDLGNAQAWRDLRRAVLAELSELQDERAEAERKFRQLRRNDESARAAVASELHEIDKICGEQRAIARCCEIAVQLIGESAEISSVEQHGKWWRIVFVRNSESLRVEGTEDRLLTKEEIRRRDAQAARESFSKAQEALSRRSLAEMQKRLRDPQTSEFEKLVAEIYIRRNTK